MGSTGMKPLKLQLSIFFISLLCIIFLFMLKPQSVIAQGNLPPWRENLECDRSLQKYRGIEYCTALDGNAYVIIVDLQESGVQIEYIIAEGYDRYGNFGECCDVNLVQGDFLSAPGCYDRENSNYYPVMSLLDAVRRVSDVAAVINADYGAHNYDEPNYRGHGPEGFTVIRGNRIDGPAVNDIDNNAERRPWLAISETSPLRVTLDQFPSGGDDGSKPDWIYTGVGGAPWLIRNGQIEYDQIENCTNATLHSCTSRVAQTAVALSQDGRWLYWVVIIGHDALGTAEFMYNTLEPQEAIKLDGGGSTQLWYGGLPGDTVEARAVYTGDSRKLSQYLGIFAELGSGIILNPEKEKPEEPNQPGWWERFWQETKERIDLWWKGFWQGIEEEFNTWRVQREAELAQWWEQQKIKFLEWLESQSQALLKELYKMLCGSTVLSMIVMSLFFRRRL